MRQKITIETLVKYIYRETSVDELFETQDALRRDPVLLGEYLELRESVRQIPKAKFNPSPSAIQNILSYSARTAVEPHL